VSPVATHGRTRLLVNLKDAKFFLIKKKERSVSFVPFPFQIALASTVYRLRTEIITLLIRFFLKAENNSRNDSIALADRHTFRRLYFNC
jgi:hypothetical protein